LNRTVLVVPTVVALAAWSLSQRPQREVELLFASDFYHNQVHANEGELWYGLFPLGTAWELDSTRIHVTPLNAGCIENGLRVTVSRAEHPLLLLRGLPDLHLGRVQSVNASDFRLRPGESREFTWRGRPFRFQARGSPGLQPRNYELSLVDRMAGLTQRIVTYHAPHGRDGIAWPPDVIWIGDLDGDGKLDFFADLKMFETPGQWALFLSSAAQPGELVRKVVQFDGMTC